MKEKQRLIILFKKKSIFIFYFCIFFVIIIKILFFIEKEKNIKQNSNLMINRQIEKDKLLKNNYINISNLKYFENLMLNKVIMNRNKEKKLSLDTPYEVNKYYYLN